MADPREGRGGGGGGQPLAMVSTPDRDPTEVRDRVRQRPARGVDRCVGDLQQPASSHASLCEPVVRRRAVGTYSDGEHLGAHGKCGYQERGSDKHKEMEEGVGRRE